LVANKTGNVRDARASYFKTMAATGYVHGYSSREGQRLVDQATTLSDLLHHDTVYPPGSSLLECGCGTGAQTVFLAPRNPAARIVSVDVSTASLEAARSRVAAAGCENVKFHQADIFNLDFPSEHFDHVFSCFLLEHLAAPETALASMKRVLRRDGTITAIEGDHGSCATRKRRNARGPCSVSSKSKGGLAVIR
jgi:ubiquinone/menaquinone biosynthesis C-methylase UbiE